MISSLLMSPTAWKYLPTVSFTRSTWFQTRMSIPSLLCKKCKGLCSHTRTLMFSPTFLSLTGRCQMKLLRSRPWHLDPRTWCWIQIALSLLHKIVEVMLYTPTKVLSQKSARLVLRTQLRRRGQLARWMGRADFSRKKYLVILRAHQGKIAISGKGNSRELWSYLRLIMRIDWWKTI